MRHETAIHQSFLAAILVVLTILLPATTQTVTPWQHYHGPWVKLPLPAPFPGWEGSYAFAPVPPLDSPRWKPAPDGQTIGYLARSRIGGAIRPLRHASFDLFQCLVSYPASGKPRCRLTLRDVATGVQVRLCNDPNPTGRILASFRQGAGALANNGMACVDLTPHLAAGANRIILINLDDTGPETRLTWGKVEFTAEEASKTAPPGFFVVQTMDFFVRLAMPKEEITQKPKNQPQPSETVPLARTEETKVPIPVVPPFLTGDQPALPPYQSGYQQAFSPNQTGYQPDPFLAQLLARQAALAQSLAWWQAYQARQIQIQRIVYYYQLQRIQAWQQYLYRMRTVQLQASGTTTPGGQPPAVQTQAAVPVPIPGGNTVVGQHITHQPIWVPGPTISVPRTVQHTTTQPTWVPGPTISVPGTGSSGGGTTYHTRTTVVVRRR